MVSIEVGGHDGSYLIFDKWFEGSVEGHVSCDQMTTLTIDAQIAATPSGSGSNDATCHDSSDCHVRAEARTQRSAEPEENCVFAYVGATSPGKLWGPIDQSECF